MYKSLLIASFAVLTANVFGMDPGYHGESSNSSNCSLLREVKQEHFGENSVESSGENVQNNRIDQNNLISSLLKVLSENDTFKSEIQDKNAEIQKITQEKDSKIRELRDKFKREYSAIAGLCGQLMESETRAYSAMTDLYEQLMESENREKNLKQRLIKANNDVFNKFYEKPPRKRSRSVREEEIQRELNSNKLRHIISNNNETIAEYKSKQEALEAEIQKLQKENQEKGETIADFQSQRNNLKRKLEEANQEIRELKKPKTENLKVFEDKVLNTRKNPEINLSKYGSFPNLEELAIESYQISDILLKKINLSKITYLSIEPNKNPINPTELGNLLSLTKNVKILNLSSTKLTYLPKEIGNLKNLEVLYLDDNILTELPSEIYTLHMLKELDIRDNPLKLSKNDFRSQNIEIFQ